MGEALHGPGQGTLTDSAGADWPNSIGGSRPPDFSAHLTLTPSDPKASPQSLLVLVLCHLALQAQPSHMIVPKGVLSGETLLLRSPGSAVSVGLVREEETV